MMITASKSNSDSNTIVFDADEESKKHNVTYDKMTGQYVHVLNDLYRYYKNEGMRNLDELIEALSCGAKSSQDFLQENGERAINQITAFSADVLKLWASPVSPEPFMVKGKTFEQAAQEYADEAGITSAVDAYISGVPIEDLLA